METHDLNGKGIISQSDKTASNHVWENRNRGTGIDSSFITTTLIVFLIVVIIIIIIIIIIIKFEQCNFCYSLNISSLVFVVLHLMHCVF